MVAESIEKRFIDRMQELLVLLPYDMKVLFEIMSDANVSPGARELAVGAAIHCLSPSDPIPDNTGLLGFVDDVVVVRLALQRLLHMADDDLASYPERFPEQFTSVDEDVGLFRSYLGESLDWLAKRVETRLTRTRYKGKDAASYVQDPEACEFLYQQGLTFTTDYDIDEEAAARLSRGKPVQEIFGRRMAEESRRIG